MRIKVNPYRCVIGDETGSDTSVFYNFPSCERLSDGSFFICARKINGLQDPAGSQVSVRYWPEEDRVEPACSPACHDMLSNPDKGIYMCHVTELSPNELIAIYPLIHTDSSKPLFSEKYDGIQPCTCRITRSHDNGHTWDLPENLAYTMPDAIIPGKIQKLADGMIGFPMEMHNLYEMPYQEPLQGRFIYSVDGGKTFDRASFFPHPEDFLAGDARCTEDSLGNLTIFFWAYDMKDMKDLKVHRTISHDSGRSFSPLEPIELKKQITSPFYIDENNFLCIYQERFSDQPGIKAMLSHDGGMTWDADSATPLFLCEGTPDGENPFAQFEQYKFGYSTMTRISQTKALATFWNTNGVTSCISVCEIWTEE